MLDRTVGRVLDVQSGEEDPRLEAYGYLTHASARDVYRAALNEILLPGFEELRADVELARRHVATRRW